MTEEILKVLKNNVVSFNEHDVIFSGDGDLIDLANKLEEAINYTHCCTKLRDEYSKPELDKYKNIKVEQTKGKSDM
jgi:hypothetical protein